MRRKLRITLITMDCPDVSCEISAEEMLSGKCMAAGDEILSIGFIPEMVPVLAERLGQKLAESMRHKLEFYPQRRKTK